MVDPFQRCSDCKSLFPTRLLKGCFFLVKKEEAERERLEIVENSDNPHENLVLAKGKFCGLCFKSVYEKGDPTFE